MGTKVTSSSGSVLKEPEIQKLQMQAKIFKENSLNKLNALKSTTQLLERQTFSGCLLYQQAFAQLFGDSKHFTEMESKSALECVDQTSHEKELKMMLTKLSERQLQIQQCKVQEVQSSVTSSGDETSSGIVSDEEIEKKGIWNAHYRFSGKNSRKSYVQKQVSSDTHCTECADERAALANLIANLTLVLRKTKRF
ncbi:hypothetical protein Tco_1092340 [Tanacetum coccineum]|uniref:Uncharacterized protein n=1 Tax=Tanacetum coccineum TaxID=301880 RepID=A0ABQ5IBJ6_9ASTR